jgi:hypothetical protein
VHSLSQEREVDICFPTAARETRREIVNPDIARGFAAVGSLDPDVRAHVVSAGLALDLHADELHSMGIGANGCDPVGSQRGCLNVGNVERANRLGCSGTLRADVVPTGSLNESHIARNAAHHGCPGTMQMSHAQSVFRFIIRLEALGMHIETAAFVLRVIDEYQFV